MHPQHLKAQFATLLEHFHLSIDEIKRLTSRQISQLYFHKRNESGGIDIPGHNRYESAEEEMAAVQRFMGDKLQNPEQVQENINKKWHKKG